MRKNSNVKRILHNTFALQILTPPTLFLLIKAIFSRQELPMQLRQRWKSRSLAINPALCDSGNVHEPYQFRPSHQFDKSVALREKLTLL